MVDFGTEALIELGYTETHSVKYATEFRNGSKIIYKINGQPLSIVIEPDADSEFVDKYDGVLYHATSLRAFPKRMNRGKSPISYGFKFNFRSSEELRAFLEEYESICLN